MEERFVGIDLGNRMMEVRFLDARGISLGRWQGKTTQKGRTDASAWADRPGWHRSVCVGLRRCTADHRHGRGEGARAELRTNVYDLPVGEEEDSEDAMKIARLICAYPEESLPTVSIPSEIEERNRAVVSEMQYVVESRRRHVNRLHSIFVRQRITTVTKAHLKTAERRWETIEMLDTYRKQVAVRLHCYICALEQDIEELEEKEREYLGEDRSSRYVLSIPGVGPQTAMAFIAHIGDGNRFNTASRVSNYVGFVPRLDQSGDTTIYGRIHKRGCSVLRNVYVQAAWALVRSTQRSPLQEKYQELIRRKGKKKAIVAIARKMLELTWTLVQKQ